MMLNAVKLHEIKLYVLANGKTQTRFGFGAGCKNYNVLVLNHYFIFFFFYYIEKYLKL